VFTERHLPSLIGLADFLTAQRGECGATQWQARYGVAHQRLTSGILPAFGEAQLLAARQNAIGSGDLLPARLLENLT
jgi:hypothetical protein